MERPLNVTLRGKSEWTEWIKLMQVCKVLRCSGKKADDEISKRRRGIYANQKVKQRKLKKEENPIRFNYDKRRNRERRKDHKGSTGIESSIRHKNKKVKKSVPTRELIFFLLIKILNFEKKVANNKKMTGFSIYITKKGGNLSFLFVRRLYYYCLFYYLLLVYCLRKRFPQSLLEKSLKEKTTPYI